MGLREFKKQKTRLALIDAALDLFLTRGYDNTTVDQIVAAVGVSQRTFFRYFSGKEQVALATAGEIEDSLVEAVERRPVEEGPLLALSNALREQLKELLHGEPEDVARYLKAQQIIINTPALLTGNLGRSNDMEQAVAAALGRRMSVDPAQDLRPYLAVAAVLSTIRLAFDSSCASFEELNVAQISDTVDRSITMVQNAFRPEWISP